MKEIEFATKKNSQSDYLIVTNSHFDYFSSRKEYIVIQFDYMFRTISLRAESDG